MRLEKMACPPSLKKCVLAVALGAIGGAHAAQLSDEDGVVVNWDNTITYNLGFRGVGQDPKIANDPIQVGSDKKFPNSGDVVSNRMGLLTEFDVTVDNKYGLRVTASAWKDFAYDDKFVAPSNPSGVYSDYTKKFYIQGTEIGDAFVFSNFNAGNTPVSVKLGRTNIYWGNTIFNGSHAISYSQGGGDGIKGVGSPGTSVKELLLPRAQLAAQAQLNDEWSLQGQYFLEYRPTRLPEGGTFDGGQDFLFIGATKLGSSPLSRGVDTLPKDDNGNFGLALRWAPADLGANVGFYLRQFDEVLPWAMRDPAKPLTYNLVYAEKVQLVGASLDMSLGDVSTGFEVSYRKDTALSSELAVSAEGARGDVLSFVANAVYTLPKTSWWDTGALVGEIAGMHLMSVSKNPKLYKGDKADGYGCALPGKEYGCATTDALALSLRFAPQWLQAAPGLDVSMPIAFQYGLYGNAPVPGARSEGQKIFGIGLEAVYLNKHRFSLNYTGSRVPTVGEKAGLPGTTVYQSGSSSANYPLNDRDRLSFTYQTTF